jgi:FtsZ-interacting cell division protein ZipA
MPELRWTLLLLGALFIAVLAWSERRKARHQSARSNHEPTISDTPAPMRVHREPAAHELPLPEIRARDPSPPQDLPVVQVDDESLVGLRLDGRHPEKELAPEEPLLSTPEEVVSDLPVLEAAEEAELEAEIDEDRTVAMSAEERVGGSPSVDWPPEEDRRIIALRLVSVSPERFSGRAVRTALVAEGFVLGKFSIFHKPDAHNRAVLSVASLSKPGMFDLETIDSQRFSGLNLFAVVSGTQPVREIFEQLLSCARNLNERLEGGLQDDRGGPLTPSRIAALRESVGAPP